MLAVSWMLLPVAIATAAEPDAIGQYRTVGEYIYVGGFASGSQDAYLVYPPDATEQLPLVVFLHGCCKNTVNDTAADYDALLRNVASHGVVVAAPLGTPNAVRDDQIHLIEALRADPSLHPALGRVDFGRIGLLGHSFGSFGSVQTAAAGVEGVLAVAAAHGVGLGPGENDVCANVSVPTFLMCGELDNTVPCAKVTDCYDRLPASLLGRSAFAELKGAGHLETQKPLPGGRWDYYIVQYLMCYLNNDANACDAIFGTSSTSLCESDLMVSCEHTGPISTVV